MENIVYHPNKLNPRKFKNDVLYRAPHSKPMLSIPQIPRAHLCRSIKFSHGDLFLLWNVFSTTSKTLFGGTKEILVHLDLFLFFEKRPPNLKFFAVKKQPNFHLFFFWKLTRLHKCAL